MCLNVDPSSITTILHMPKVRITSKTNIFARTADSLNVVSDNTTSCLISHMQFIRYLLLPSVSKVAPDDQRWTCISKMAL